jgi:dTMP kinase
MPLYDAASREFARDGGNLDRFGRKSGSYHEALANTFKQLAIDDPLRFRIIDGLGTPAEVTARCLAALEDLLP